MRDEGGTSGGLVLRLRKGYISRTIQTQRLVPQPHFRDPFQTSIELNIQIQIFIFTFPRSQLTLEPGNRGVERSLLARLHLRVREIASDGEPVGASLKIFPLVSRSKLPVSQNLVGDGLRLEREPLIMRAAVDEDGSLGQLEIFLGMVLV